MSKISRGFNFRSVYAKNTGHVPLYCACNELSDDIILALFERKRTKLASAGAFVAFHPGGDVKNVT